MSDDAFVEATRLLALILDEIKGLRADMKARQPPKPAPSGGANATGGREWGRCLLPQLRTE